MTIERSPLLGVELRYLAAFQAVASEKSFRLAGLRLGLGQSAISQRIAALERAIGQRLIERSPGSRALRLTPEGEIVLRHTDAIIARLRAAEADLAAAGHGQPGELRLGLTEEIAVRVLPQAARRFRQSYPEIRLRSTDSSTDLTLIRAIEQDLLDLAFVELPVPKGPFEVVELLSDPYVLVTPNDLIPPPRSITVHDLARIPLIGHSDCRGLRRLEDQLRAQGIGLSFVARSTSNTVIQALTGAGLGAAILPALAVDMTDSQIAVHAFEDLPPRVVVILRAASRRASDIEQAFIEASRAVAAELEHTRVRRQATAA
jgi:DNA-binding transcriptional LysR family regulator